MKPGHLTPTKAHGRRAMAKALPSRICKYSQCRKEFTPTRPLQVTCLNPRCANGYGKEKRERKERRAAALERRERKMKLQQLKPLSTLCKEAQRYVNQAIRARDEVFGTCIACGAPRIDDAGHFFAVGSKYRTSPLRFDEMNIHGCCSKCNRFIGGGNVREYENGLRLRYGCRYVEVLFEKKAKADRGELPALTKEQVLAIAAEARRWKRELLKNRRQA